MSQVVQALHRTFGTGISRGLASGTFRDIPSSHSASWDYLGCLEWYQNIFETGKVRGNPEQPWVTWDNAMNKIHILLGKSCQGS